MSFFRWAASLLTGPIIEGALSAYKAKLAAGNTTERLLADVVQKDLELQVRERELDADYRKSILGRWWEVTNLFGYTTLAFYAKVIIWDTMLGLGTTPPIRGAVATWASMVITFYFGKRTLETGAMIFARIFRKK